MTRAPSFPHTAVRRSQQLLLNALDVHLMPAVSSGLMLCVSGGPDSRALLEVCARWSGRLRGHIVVASVDHGTRAGAHAECEHVCRRARALGFAAVPLHAGPTVAAAEHELRALRYHLLHDAAVKSGVATLVLAHHAGDVREHVRMRAAGIADGHLAVRTTHHYGEAQHARVRPFLAIEKSSLAAALSALCVRDRFVDAETRSWRARARQGAQLPTGHIAPHVRDAEDDLWLQQAATALIHGDGRTASFGPRPLLRRALMQLARRAEVADPRALSAGIDELVQAATEGRSTQIRWSNHIVVRVDPKKHVVELADKPHPAYAAPSAMPKG